MLRSILFLLLVCGCHVAQGWEDDFAGKGLATRWGWRVPVAGPTLSLDERPGWLRIRLPDRPNGFNHWNEPKPVDEAPQLRTVAPEGDWQLEVRVHLEMISPDNSFLLGLMTGASDESLVTMGAFQYSGFGKPPEVWFEPTGTSGLFRCPVDARDVYLRLVRKGNLCRGQVGRDGKTWTEAGCYIMGQAPRFLGLIAKTFSAGPPVVFDVDYVRLTPIPAPQPAGRRTLVGVGGDYPTGYRGLLARLGLPYEVLIDYQLTDAQVLRRFDLLLVGSVNGSLQDQAHRAIMAYVQAGGTALIDSRACPPPPIVPGKGNSARDLPDIVLDVPFGPLQTWLGDTTRFPAGESRYHFAPTSTEGLQILAHFDSKPAVKNGKKGTTLPPGTPAIWALPVGKGLLVYSSPSIGATLSWGPDHDALAEALLHCLGGDALRPQLVEEGARFGRKQSGLTEGSECAVPAVALPPPFHWRTLDSDAGSLPAGVARIKGKPAPEFNVSGTYRPGQGKAALLLNHWSDRFSVRLDLVGDSARLTRTENGRTVATAETGLGGAEEIPFLLKERRDRIVFIASGHQAEIPSDGLWEGTLAGGGEALGNLRYQPVAPAFLSDDFMRGENEKGAWETVSGTWSVRATGNAKMGANPFTYRCQKASGTALSVAGLPFWDDYGFQVSAKPDAKTGAMGMAFHYRDPKNYLLFRLRVGDAAKDKGGAEIVRVLDGRESVLASGDGCLENGQWYRLAVQTRDGAVTARVDGRDVVSTRDDVLPSGKVGLVVRDCDADFDDAAVRPLLDTAETHMVELDGTVPRFAGTMDRDTWAGTALQWRASSQTPGLFWRHGDFLGDVDLSFACDFGGAGGTGATLTLLLVPRAGDVESGYALTMRPLGASAGQSDLVDYDVTWSRRGTLIGRSAVTAGPKPVLALRRVGANLTALVDDQTVLASWLAEERSECTKLGFLATGFMPRISGLRLEAGNVLDYYFDHAPTDWWVDSGTWELAVRWPCTPEWSWLAGESRSVAALWHKHQFDGDQTLDLHVGPRTVDHGDKHPREICRAFNVVICGDGKDVKSGYSFVVGDGKSGSGATFWRKGKIVARVPEYRIFSDAHNQWINVRAEKRGATVRLWVGDQRLFSWEDPEPLPGGRLAVWTEDNAVMIPRVTIYHNGATPTLARK
jgi:hypothetical protein